jgi:hypothetical protein
MFGFFRPFEPGFNVQPPADEEVPGFRLDPGGPVQTDGVASGPPLSYTLAGWTPNADAYGNAETALSNSYGPSYWRDARDAAEKLGEGLNATVNGAYSVFSGTGNLAREAGRGLGLYGSEEAARFRQEMNAAGQGLRAVAQNPGLAARLAYEGGSAAFKAQPLLPFYLGGRAGMGLLLGLHGIPIAPLAVAGDALHAIEKGHNAIDAGLYGLFGNRPGDR